MTAQLIFFLGAAQPSGKVTSTLEFPSTTTRMMRYFEAFSHSKLPSDLADMTPNLSFKDSGYNAADVLFEMVPI